MLKPFLVAVCACLLFACSSDEISVSDKDGYDKQKNLLVKEEKQKPLTFLKLYASDRKNMLGSTVVKGAVSNSATVCSYKDVRIKLLSFNNEGKILEEHEDVLTGAIKPNDSKDFRLRYHLPGSADSVALSIMSATVAE